MSTPRLGIVAVVVAVVVGLGVSCTGFREDEIECEQALVRLHECCPGFDTKVVDCSYRDRLDCSDNVTGHLYPALSLDDSRCLQQKSCEDLVSSGACSRAQEAKRRLVDVDDKSSSTPSRDPVCKP